MIRAILGLRRLPHVDPLEVREFATSAFRPILVRYCEAAGATGFELRPALVLEESARFHAIWGGTSPFDLIVELYWPDGPSCREGSGRPEALAISQELQAANTLFDSVQSTLTFVQD